ncbi:hypothetical protein [Kribbella sp. VKM Ac-2569]|uniref:hypothetical protein n=1 Tax=Kribbella sp. VKM Ac-2569 TaxID=2512220 RepID=UPI001300B832|nr:hypothetical protein [Kribbella sp. VKM Ac-2569]
MAFLYVQIGLSPPAGATSVRTDQLLKAFCCTAVESAQFRYSFAAAGRLEAARVLDVYGGQPQLAI